MDTDIDLDVFILADGTIKFLYYDELKPLLSIGKCEIARASHVEPEMTPYGLFWFADMSPVWGPLLGPFGTRKEAINEEVAWLVENWMNKQDIPSLMEK